MQVNQQVRPLLEKIRQPTDKQEFQCQIAVDVDVKSGRRLASMPFMPFLTSMIDVIHVRVID